MFIWDLVLIGICMYFVNLIRNRKLSEEMLYIVVLRRYGKYSMNGKLGIKYKGCVEGVWIFFCI